MSTVIRVPSLTDPNLVYDVVRDGDRRTCTHPFFKPGETCKHMAVADAAEHLLARCAEHHDGDGASACADCVAALVSASMRKVKRGYVTKSVMKDKMAQVREEAKTQRATMRRVK